MMKHSKVQIKISDSLQTAMRLIDGGSVGVGYVVNESGKQLGSLTDREIRKSILQGFDAQESVGKLLAAGGGKTGQTAKSADCILVVGGAGYLGSILSRKLIKLGYKVKVLDILLFGREPIEDLLYHPKFELIEGDIRNVSVVSDALKDVDAVINLAAIVGDPACKKYPESAIETNYLANKLLAEACKYQQINRYIYASTCSVYGIGGTKLDENAPLHPVSLYARSKIQSEKGILSLIDENFAPCILRMSTLYGLSPRMRFDLVVNTMTMKAVTEGVITVHGGKQWRPLLHIADAADAYIACLQAPIKQIKGQIFNVGADRQNFRIAAIGKLVKAGVPRAKLIVQPDSADPRDYLVSFGKIRRQLGFMTRMTVPLAVREIKNALQQGAIKNVKDPKYYNVWEN
jgi:nucleoside-diphosphate-sugar epimerase